MTARIDPLIAEYRSRAGGRDLAHFRVALKESDLEIAASRRIPEQAMSVLAAHRRELEAYIAERPEFLAALVPVAVHAHAPRVVVAMACAAWAAGVGPMAAVAGALADEVGRALGRQCADVIVENGGDVHCRVSRPRTLAIDAGLSPLSFRLGVRVTPQMGETGVCTSSGTRGQSLSFGRADAACVVAGCAALADAAATAVGNAVVGAGAIEAGLAVARAIAGVRGAVVIVGEHLGAWGSIELAEITA